MQLTVCESVSLTLTSSVFFFFFMVSMLLFFKRFARRQHQTTSAARINVARRQNVTFASFKLSILSPFFVVCFAFTAVTLTKQTNKQNKRRAQIGGQLLARPAPISGSLLAPPAGQSAQLSPSGPGGASIPHYASAKQS